MTRRRVKTGFGLAVLVSLLIVISFSASGEGEEYIQYDFSKPDQVFKTTMSETVVGAGIDPAVLYQVLQAGQVVIVNDRPNNPDLEWLTTSGILVNAPAEQMFAVIKDVDKYPEFMAQVGKSWAEPKTDEIDQIFYELVIQILFLKVKVPYSVYHYNRPPYRVDWVMAGGEFNCNYGAYEVVPIPGQPDRSMLFYTSYSQPRTQVVASLYERIPYLDMMINLSTGTLWVKALKDQAEELFKKSGGNASPPSSEKLDLVKFISDHPEPLARLASRGKVVFLEKTEPRYYTGGAIVDKPLEHVHKSIIDLEGMSSISKHYSINILEKTENTARGEFHTVIRLMVDFESDYLVDYTFEPPGRMAFVADSEEQSKGMAGSWEMTELDPGRTLVFYRNTADMKSQGMMMRQLLKIEPTFEYALMACTTQYTVTDMKIWCEASPAERKRLAEEAAKKE